MALVTDVLTAIEGVLVELVVLVLGAEVVLRLDEDWVVVLIDVLEADVVLLLDVVEVNIVLVAL